MDLVETRIITAILSEVIANILNTSNTNLLKRNIGYLPNNTARYLDFAGEKILQTPLNCTICDLPMVHQLITSDNLHPFLGVLVCGVRNCYKFCQTKLKISANCVIPIDHLFCLWCTLLHTSRKAKTFNFDAIQKRRIHSKSVGTYFWKCKCLRQFCEKCIQKHAAETIPTTEWWICFQCDSRPLWSLRALADEVLAYNDPLRKAESGKAARDKGVQGIPTTTVTGETTYCIICYESPIQMAFSPCGHLCLCVTCSETYKRNPTSCPKCRQPYTDVIRIYQE